MQNTVFYLENSYHQHEKLFFILLKLANALVSFKAMHHLAIIHTGKIATEFKIDLI
jgi:hypothetical protein